MRDALCVARCQFAGSCGVKIFRFFFSSSAVALTGHAGARRRLMADGLRAGQTGAKRKSKNYSCVDFTGSDWCGWCIRLRREVFSQPEFQEYANKNLVLLEIDFPRAKEQSRDLRTAEPKSGHAIQDPGFPTIVVLNGEGKKVGVLGYMPGGASAFISELEKLRKG